VSLFLCVVVIYGSMQKKENLPHVKFPNILTKTKLTTKKTNLLLLIRQK
jgi:hypothetical protein